MKSLLLLAGAAGLLLYANASSQPETNESIPVETKRQLLTSYIRQAAKESASVQVFLLAVGSMTAAEIEDCYRQLITYHSHGIKPEQTPDILQLWGRLSAIATKYGIEDDLLYGN